MSQVTVEGRLFSEDMFFRYGYEGQTYDDIAQEYEVDVLWIFRVLQAHGEILRAYKAGIAARGEVEAVRAEQALYGAIRTRTVRKQQINKQTGEVESLETEVLPDIGAVERVLENRAPDRWGKKGEEGGRVTNVFIQQANMQLSERSREVERLEREAREYASTD